MVQPCAVAGPGCWTVTLCACLGVCMSTGGLPVCAESHAGVPRCASAREYVGEHATVCVGHPPGAYTPRGSVSMQGCVCAQEPP